MEIIRDDKGSGGHAKLKRTKQKNTNKLDATLNSTYNIDCRQKSIFNEIDLDNIYKTISEVTYSKPDIDNAVKKYWPRVKWNKNSNRK